MNVHTYTRMHIQMDRQTQAQHASDAIYRTGEGYQSAKTDRKAVHEWKGRRGILLL